MLDKCANPACNTRFKYLRGGRLFLLNSGEPQPDEDGVSTGRRTEHFWLCCRCSASHTLLLDGPGRMSCVPLAPAWSPGQPGPGIAGKDVTLVSASAWRSLPLWNDALGGWCCDE